MTFRLNYISLYDSLEGYKEENFYFKDFEELHHLIVWVVLQERYFDENYCNWLFVSNPLRDNIINFKCDSEYFLFSIEEYKSYSNDELKQLLKDYEVYK